MRHCNLPPRRHDFTTLCHLAIAVFLFLFNAAPAPAQTRQLVWAGVAGNSGVSGPSLVRGALGRQGGGVVMDGTGHLITGGGDRVNLLDASGRLLHSIALPQADWVLAGPQFALTGNTLYFLAGKPVRYEYNIGLLADPFAMAEPNLCRADLNGTSSTIVVPRKSLPWQSPLTNGEVTLATGPTGKLYLGMTTRLKPEDKLSYCVWQVSLDGTLRLLFQRERGGGRFIIDEKGVFYLGQGSVEKVDENGQPVERFAPIGFPNLGAVPTGYTGAVLLTKGFLWDYGHYGFIGRFTRDYQASPGALVQWLHPLSWVAQVADGPNGTYYIKSNEALYQAEVRDERLHLLRRLGSLPRVDCLSLTSDGYLAVGTDNPPLVNWYDFDAHDAGAAPVRGVYPGTMAQGFSEGSGVVCLTTAAYAFQETIPRPPQFTLNRFEPEPFSNAGNQATNLGSGVFDHPIAALISLNNCLYGLDTGTNQMVTATRDKELKFTPISRADLTPNIPEAARLHSLCTLGADSLAVTAGNTVYAFQLTPDGKWNPLWTLAGPAKTDVFGEELYVAASANVIAVSDTLRHRVLVLQTAADAKAAPVLAARFGILDKPGADEKSLDTPRLITVAGSQLAVYDSGNQRVVKLRLR